MAIDPRDVEICVSLSADSGDVHGAVVPPIAQTALFSYPSFEELNEGLGAEHRSHVYTRGCNPTVEVLEAKLAALERGEACKVLRVGYGGDQRDLPRAARIRRPCSVRQPGLRSDDRAGGAFTAVRHHLRRGPGLGPGGGGAGAAA